MDSILDLFPTTVYTCPFCSWALTAEGLAVYDRAGIEAALTGHMDDEHAGWTLEQVRQAVSSKTEDAT